MPRQAVMLLLALAVALAGCGTDADEETTSGSLTMTVYASAPLRGEGAREGRDLVDAMKLALQEAGGRAGPFTLNLVVLDPTDPDSGRWGHDEVLANARTAIEDRNTIAYVGELDSAASALALPVLNEGGVPQVSPLSTYTGLTRRVRAGRGEPDRFYPSGRRTFARVVPRGEVEAAVIAGRLREAGERRVVVVRERGGRAEDRLGARDLADQVVAAARAAGLEVVEEATVDARGAGVRERAAELARAGADAAVVAGQDPGAAARLLDALHEADPGLALHAPGALARPELAEALAPGTAARLRLTSAQPDLRRGPGARFAARFRRVLGRAPGPGAAAGHDAMATVLAAVRAAGPRGNDRDAVLGALLGLRGVEGPSGRFGIDEKGDTTRVRLSEVRVRDGALVHRPAG